MTKARRYITKLRRTAANPSAPHRERREASGELWTRTARHASGLVTAEDVKRVMKGHRTLMAKAPQQRTLPPRPGVAKTSVRLEEMFATDSNLLLARPHGLDFQQLRTVVRRDPMLRAIIGTRIAQVQRFLRPSKEIWKPGFGLRFKDPSREITDADNARLNYLRRYLTNCGAEFDPHKRRGLYKRDGLSAFVAKHVEDTLTFDAAPVEIVRTFGGRPHGFVAVDGARVYLTEPMSDDLEALPWLAEIDMPDPDDATAILAFEGRPVNYYTNDELLYPVRNPTTNHYAMGYGQPEAEELIEVVTAFLNAMSLNARGFSDNSIPQGLLSITGEFDADEIEEFKAEWDAQVQGLSNRWRLPVFFSDEQGEIQFTPLGSNFTEMMFERWMTFLTAIKCALYKIDPEEINFSAFTNKPATLGGSDTEERLASSRDKGLWPLLMFVADTLNDILYSVDPEIEMFWTGLEPDQQALKGEAEKAMLFGEYRVSKGLPLTGVPELDNAPMNPSLQGVYSRVLQRQSGEPQTAQEEQDEKERGNDAGEQGESPQPASGGLRQDRRTDAE